MNIALLEFMGILVISFPRRSRRQLREVVPERKRVVNAHFASG
jgi:hypothetical protein